MGESRRNQDCYFSDEEYEKHLFNSTEADDKKETVCNDRIRTAFEIANDTRKFEIEHLWTRGTYFWAFILAAFTAHFTFFENRFDGKDISFCEILELSDFSLLVLTVTAFFCFFFSYIWIIVNKGSLFWQQNWERHVSQLEEKNAGRLFEIIMNKRNEELCSPSIFSFKPYRFSLAKVSLLTGIVLMFAGLVLLCFYVYILADRLFPFSGIFLIALICLVFFVCIPHALSGDSKGAGKKTAKWYSKLTKIF